MPHTVWRRRSRRPRCRLHKGCSPQCPWGSSCHFHRRTRHRRNCHHGSPQCTGTGRHQHRQSTAHHWHTARCRTRRRCSRMGSSCCSRRPERTTCPEPLRQRFRSEHSRPWPYQARRRPQSYPGGHHCTSLQSIQSGMRIGTRRQQSMRRHSTRCRLRCACTASRRTHWCPRRTYRPRIRPHSRRRSGCPRQSTHRR